MSIGLKGLIDYCEEYQHNVVGFLMIDIFKLERFTRKISLQFLLYFLIYHGKHFYYDRYFKTPSSTPPYFDLFGGIRSHMNQSTILNKCSLFKNSSSMILSPSLHNIYGEIDVADMQGIIRHTKYLKDVDHFAKRSSSYLNYLPSMCQKRLILDSHEKKIFGRKLISLDFCIKPYKGIESFVHSALLPRSVPFEKYLLNRQQDDL